jgi:3-hydroxybutyryl-CoA dehydrogenase
VTRRQSRTVVQDDVVDTPAVPPASSGEPSHREHDGGHKHTTVSARGAAVGALRAVLPETVGTLNSPTVEHTVMNVAVLGVGAAGKEISRLCARGGNEVSVHAGNPSAAMDAIDVIERHLERADVHGVSLDATTGLTAAVSNVDLVVETSTDDADRLGERFTEVERLVDKETLLATSQPSLSVTAAASALDRPGRALGLRVHPDDTDVVEVVTTDQTTPETLDRAAGVVESLGATPLFVADTPGPVSGRLAVALELEAMRLLETGAAGVETIDDLLVTGYDHAVGPLERADRVGLDRRLDLLEYLEREVGERYEPPEMLADRVARGKTGRNAGEGFYAWENGDPVRPAVDGPAFGRPDR